MKKIFFLLLLFSAANLHAQNIFKATIKNKETNQPIAGAVVSLDNSAKTLSNSNGIAQIVNVSNGKHIITYSHTGFITKTDTLDFPLSSVIVLLEEEEEELEEVIVQSTRTSRTINNTPTRVETIDGEEVEEKANMRPANVSMLLHESTGLQVQTTSATSGNASIRVQGLDGRYTQLLKDGYANFGNFASGLSILEIPPLDLKQVEIIKGPASTLYGGGAIAGVVNFISKTPKEKAEYNFMFNQSNIGQTNIGGYASQKKGKWGYTLLGLVNFQKAYDVDGDDFSELSKSNNFTINPRLFFYPNETTTLMIGNSFTKGENTGGDMQVIKGNGNSNHSYFERNNTTRNTTTFELDKKFTNGSFKLKQSLSFFKREINLPMYRFYGSNTNSFTDASYLHNSKQHTLIAGGNFVFDKLRHEPYAPNYELSTQMHTIGLYLQDTWDITNNIKIESGLRLDDFTVKNASYKKSEAYLLPRVSALFKINNKWSSRIGGGLGYKAPTVFTEQTESMQYKFIKPLNGVSAEKSIGATADVNYRSKLGEDFSLSINQLFFYTRISNPLVLETNAAGFSAFQNTVQPVHSKGFETNVKFIFKEDFKLFIGYTYTDAKAKYLSGNQFLPLLPKNKLNLALLYEKENNFKFGLEGYFTDRQYLYNGTQTSSFWEFGFMAEKTINKIALFINFENFTDQRQSKYKQVANGPHTNPSFDDVWNHLEGFVVNGGIKIKL
jgi:outer membrane receptor for ferrienterochelin and colicins